MKEMLKELSIDNNKKIRLLSVGWICIYLNTSQIVAKYYICPIKGVPFPFIFLRLSILSLQQMDRYITALPPSISLLVYS